jgi:alkylation response protein AidB-like acyl-CoA dehydrogenase
MNFALSSEQELLGETASRFCADHRPAIVEPGDGFRVDRQVWRQAADIGFFSLREVGPDSTRRTGAVNAALVALEAATELFPGPLAATMLAADLLPDGRTGELIVAAVRRPRRGPVLVEHLASADAVLVFDPSGVAVVDVDGLRWEPAQPIDPLTPVALIEDLPAGTRVGDADMAADLERYALVLGAAEHAGLAARACEQSMTYACHREQFGRPIAGFQVLKHFLADMAVEAELARAVALYAAGMLDSGSEAEAIRWSLAAVVAAEQAAVKNAELSIQIHGAMGFAWETGLHLVLRRAWAIAQRTAALDAPAALAATLLESSQDDEIQEPQLVSVKGSDADRQR